MKEERSCKLLVLLFSFHMILPQSIQSAKERKDGATPSQRPPEERKSLPPASPGRFTCLVSSAISASSPHPHRILVLPATVYILHPYI